MKRMTTLLCTWVLIAVPTLTWAQTFEDNMSAVEVTDQTSVHDNRPKGAPRGFQPRVGRNAAAKYMGAHPDSNHSGEEPVGPSSGMSAPRRIASSDSHYLALHIGGYVSDNSYKWGTQDGEEDIGKLNVGVSYRVGEWVNSMDLLLRIDFSTFGPDGGNATKLSFLPIVSFPDASSRFPLYFGGGIGAGIFVNQISDESSLSLDYQLLAGARFFDVVGNTGFFIEAGIKNHLFLLSDGQFNGTFATVGTVFTF